MALLDLMAGANFRNEAAGRVVVFPMGRRNRGYVVRSESEEQKIKSFLKMFYAAHFSILLLGYFLASEWSRELSYALGRPAAHLFRTLGISVGIYSLVAGVPYFLLWRSYRKAFLRFISPQDEVLVGKPARNPALVALGVGLIAVAILFLLGVAYLIRAK
jgi:hypothetical protein